MKVKKVDSSELKKVEDVKLLVIKVDEEDIIPLTVNKKKWHEMKAEYREEFEKQLVQKQVDSQPLEYSV